VARWITVMGDELHLRAGDLAVERVGREEPARRERETRGPTARR
jgi:hypothetical protein